MSFSVVVSARAERFSDMKGSFHKPNYCLPFNGWGPRRMSRDSAVRLGYQPCKRCKP